MRCFAPVRPGVRGAGRQLAVLLLSARHVATHDSGVSIESQRPAPTPAPTPASASASGEAVRVRGLDGLGALAVAAVVAYHLGAPWLPGGFLGVDLFFVISGYLITSLLTAQRRRSSRFRLRVFGIRRARRLLPARWAVLTATACAATLTGGDAWAGLRGNVVAALTYSSNWWQITQHEAHSAQFGAKPELQQLWSLAVEEQFYLRWPPLLSAHHGRLAQAHAPGGARRGPRRRPVHGDGTALLPRCPARIGLAMHSSPTGDR